MFDHPISAWILSYPCSIQQVDGMLTRFVHLYKEEHGDLDKGLCMFHLANSNELLFAA